MKNTVRNILDTVAVRSAWRRIILLWKPMGVWTLLVWTIIAIILAPISSAILGLQFFRSGKLVIGNEELLTWILSPVGISYMLLAASLTLTGWTLQFAGLFQIVTDDIHGRKLKLKNIALRIIGRTPLLFRLSVFLVAVALLLAFPLAAGLGIIYELFLDVYDINYYLSAAPIEWHLTLLASAGWFFIWAAASFYLLARSLLALPVYLYGQKSIRESIIYSWNIDRKQSKKNLKTITVLIFFWILVRFTADALFFFISAEIIKGIGHFIHSLRLIALASGLYIAGTFIIDAIISFLGFSHISTLITKLFYSDLDISTQAPPSRPKFKRLITLNKKLLEPRRLISAISVAIIASMLISGYMIDQIQQSDINADVKIAAHRAGPPVAPENTLQALDLTLQTEAEYAEIDVQLTRDSVVVVAHDFDLMRMANNPARISHTDYHRIQQIFAKGHEENPNISQTLNTLDDFLEAAQDRIKLMIEFKQSEPALIQRVITAVREHSMSDQVILITLNPGSINEIRETAPEITAGYVSAYSLGNLSRLPVQLLAMNHRAITPQLLTRARQENMDVYAWTVNKAPTMAKLIELGVDGIITDHPQLGIQIRNEMQQLSTAERLILQFQRLAIGNEEWE